MFLGVNLSPQAPNARPAHTPRRMIGVTISARDIETAFAELQQALALFDQDGRLVRSNQAFNDLLALDGHPEFLTTDAHTRARLFDVRDAHGRRVRASRLPVARALNSDALIGVVGTDLRVRALDGVELELHVTATPLATRAGRITGCLVMLYDLAPTRRATAQVREAAGRMTALTQDVVARARERDAILEAMSDGVLLFDADGNLRLVNPTARELLEVAPDMPPDEMLALMTQRLWDMPRTDLAGRRLPREEWPLSRVLRGEQRTGAEGVAADATRRFADGSEHVLSISAAPIYQGDRLVGAVELLRDETEERRWERQVAEHASQIGGIFEAMTEGLAFYNAAGRVARMNASARRLLGYDAAEEWTGPARPLWSEHPALQDENGQLLDPHAWPLARILRGETLSAERAVDVRIRGSNGAEGVLAASGAPVYDAKQHIIGAVLSLRDVTEARRQDIARAQVMSVVSHELRNPLAAISMATSLLEKQAETSNPPSGDALDVLTDGITKMTRLVNDLVEAARMETGHLSLRVVSSDLRTLCRNVASELVRTAQRAIALYLPKRPIEVTVDPIRIGQVLTNLLTNAVKYSPPESPITLRLFRSRGMAHVEVRDEGPGIPPEARTRLFERFFRVEGIQVLNGSGAGMGLGLYIARSLIELHGGSVGVKSVVGRGSTFWFTLPLSGSGAG